MRVFAMLAVVAMVGVSGCGQGPEAPYTMGPAEATESDEASAESMTPEQLQAEMEQIADEARADAQNNEVLAERLKESVGEATARLEDANKTEAWRQRAARMLAGGDADAVAGTTRGGWYNWRGPFQNGLTLNAVTSLEPAWKKQGLKGRGTPVIVGDRLYAMAYEGEKDELVELLVCLNADTGEEIWRHVFPDFISDIIYDRYAIGAPTVDPATGHIYCLTTPGLMNAFDKDGKLLWQHSMMETFGRLTFPNGRTGAPVIVGDLVIVHGITSNWGKQGPGRDRFFAFEKSSGDVVWITAPGTGPPFLKDSSFSTPVVERRGNRTVFYAGTGCGNVVCVNALTGEPLWRFQMGIGGVNASPVIVGDTLIAIHGKENLDSTEVGRMVALKLPDPAKLDDGDGEPKKLDGSAELWRADLASFTSSPTRGVDAIYQTVATGELVATDPESGEEKWRLKLSTSQLHASPLNAGGKLYVPFPSGVMHVVDVRGDKPNVIKEIDLGGSALGQPAVHDGRLYVFSTKGLYCFGEAGGGGANDAGVSMDGPLPSGSSDGSAEVMQIVPAEVTLRPGEREKLRYWFMTERGFERPAPEGVFYEIEKFVPPAARVKTEIDARLRTNAIIAEDDAKLSAGAYRARVGELTATGRGRVLPSPPYRFDFEDTELTVEHETDGVKFAYPPLPWIGARLKWEVREVDGTKALAKTLDRILFQRATTFIGHADDADYTLTADVRTDRRRRLMGEIGLVNQRYLITLKAIQQQIEVSSNHERLKVAAPMTIKPETWYTLKTRVDVNDDRTGVVRAKAWERGTAEPEKWSIEVPVDVAHERGSPGFFGFAPQSKVRVYVDNIRVEPND